jgi:alkane 1-monooxygenase
MKDLKYLSCYLIPLCAWLAIENPEHLAFLPLIFSFAFLPALELFLPANSHNINHEEEGFRLSDRMYDYILYLSFPIQWGILIYFLFKVNTTDYSVLQLTGITLGVGICSGVLGINAAHELGHRMHKFEQLLAQGLLLSSLYTHFFIEHNRGHHKHVATPLDPASARLNEPVYAFILRSVSGSYLSAWRIQLSLLRKDGKSFFSIHNKMLVFQILQSGLVLGIFLIFNAKTAMLFLATAATGIVLLEVINYIEHYGMQRKQLADGKYEKVLPSHSWNANYPLGRIMLFELTRHADHHYKASRKYQVLRHWDQSPELPAGYPAMMLLSTIPPLWFRIMNPKVQKLRNTSAEPAVHIA